MTASKRKHQETVSNFNIIPKKLNVHEKNNTLKNVSQTLLQKQCLKLTKNPSNKIELPPEAKQLIEKFYKDLDKIELRQCNICREVWSNIKNSICNRCKRDKESIKKFSVENDTVPSPIPNELQDLTQVEKILIARVLPIMNIYCQPKGGQRTYKGHVITFPCNVQRVADILPNLPTDFD